MVNYFLGAALVAVPFYIMNANKTQAALSQDYLFAVAAFVFALISGVRANLRIAIAALLVAFWAFQAQDAFSIFALYRTGLCAAGVAFVAAVYAKKTEISVPFIGKVLAAVCFFESSWAILQHFGVDLHQIYLSGHTVINTKPIGVIGSLGNPNHSGALIACLMPFLPFALLPVPIVALFLLKSALPVVCAFIGMVALYSYQKGSYRAILWATCALFVAGCALVAGLIPKGSYFSDTGRIEAWVEILKTAGFTLFGHGLDFMPMTFAKTIINGQRFVHAHNELIDLYVAGGLLSSAVALYLILPVFKNKGNPAINACAISLTVNAPGNFTFHIAPLFMVFGLCYALQLSEE